MRILSTKICWEVVDLFGFAVLAIHAGGFILAGIELGLQHSASIRWDILCVQRKTNDQVPRPDEA